MKIGMLLLLFIGIISVSCSNGGPIEQTKTAAEEETRQQQKRSNRFALAGGDMAKSGKLELAIAQYDEAIKLDSTNALAYLSRGWAYNELGQSQRAINDYTEAIKHEKNGIRGLKHLRLLNSRNMSSTPTGGSLTSNKERPRRLSRITIGPLT